MTSEPSEEFEDEVEGEEEDEVANETPQKRSRKKFHFTIELDNQLIKTVIEENPYAYAGKDTNPSWDLVARRMDEIAGTQGLLARTCRDRLERLLVYCEQDHPLLKVPSELDGEGQQRVELLQQMLQLREESLKKSGQRILRPRVKSRAKSARRSMPYGPYQPVTRTEQQQAQVVYTYTTAVQPGDVHAPDAETRAATLAILNPVDESHHDGSQARVFRPTDVSFNGQRAVVLDPQERSIVLELLESRRQDDERRREELEIRRHEAETRRQEVEKVAENRRQEAEVQKMKIELERQRWEADQKEREADRKDREARLALEGEERKIVIQFMRRNLFPNGSSEPPY